MLVVPFCWSVATLMIRVGIFSSRASALRHEVFFCSLGQRGPQFRVKTSAATTDAPARETSTAYGAGQITVLEGLEAVRYVTTVQSPHK